MSRKPTLTIVELADADNELLYGLLASYPPEATVMDLLHLWQIGDIKVFVTSPGSRPVYFAVSVLEDFGDKTLHINAVWVRNAATGSSWKTWLRVLTRLGKSWRCSGIESQVSSGRQIKALRKLGLVCKSVTMRLDI